jgi:hypothetical protein
MLVLHRLNQDGLVAQRQCGNQPLDVFPSSVTGRVKCDAIEGHVDCHGSRVSALPPWPCGDVLGCVELGSSALSARKFIIDIRAQWLAHGNPDSCANV